MLDISNINADRIVHSYFMPSIPWVIGLRSVFAVYCSTILLTGLITEMKDGYWFAYFTHLTYLGLTTYFWVFHININSYTLYTNYYTRHIQCKNI
jgi:hypothetical protein